MNPIRILIVDDHAILRMGLATLLNGKPGLEVVGDASGGEAAVKAAKKLTPDVIVMDLVMPGMDGSEATRRIMEDNPSANVILLTTFSTSDGIVKTLDAGAKGAVMKNCDFDELVSAIRKVAEGKSYVSPDIKRIIAADPPATPLSPRQTQILEAIARGLSNPEIAKQLGISVDMVKEHVETIFSKIGAASRSEAVAIAYRKRIIRSQESM